MKKSAKFMSAALLAIMLGGAAYADDPTQDTVVATVNGVDITLGQMIAMRAGLPAQYQQLPDDVIFKGVLDQIVQETVLSQTLNGAQTKLQALTIENQTRSYLANSVLRTTADAAVTEDALKAAYDEKYAKAAPKQEFEAAHILVATEEEAKAIKADLDAGKDFATIAKEKSTDTGSGANGGDLGWFGAGMMVKEFEDAVAAMKKGEVSAPVKTQFGWHIIKLNDTRTAAVPAFDEVKAELSGDLQQQAVEKQVTDLVAAAKVEKKTEGIDPAILKKLELLQD